MGVHTILTYHIGTKSYQVSGKNNRLPFLDILGYLKNTHKNPKFGRVRQVPIRELGWEFPSWDLSHCAKFGIFMGIQKWESVIFSCVYSVNIALLLQSNQVKRTRR